MKYQYFALSILIIFATKVTAVPIDIDTKQWVSEYSPSSGKRSDQDVWLGLSAGTPKKKGNSSGTLVSDFTLDGDFVFSGHFMPTFAYNKSCAVAANNTCDDDDILGLVFGWQDQNNHYRLGWSQGDGTNKSGVKDVTGKTGLFLVKEVEGKSNTVKYWGSDFWVENVDYMFSISRVANDISFMITGLMQNVAGIQNAIVPTAAQQLVNLEALGTEKVINHTFSDSTFTSGRVGVYTESQTAQFSVLSVEVPTPPSQRPPSVSEPGTLGILVASFFGIALVRKRVKS